ncbi:MAG: immunoglobulin domain-containing protein [Nibricoccus sp.]
MKLYTLYYRFRWVQMPSAFLVVLLQRVPLLRMLTQAECAVEGSGGVVLKSVFALAALGAYDTVAGATMFGVSPATPSSGAPGTQFSISGTTGTAMTETFTVSGAPGNPRSWSVSGTLPAGLSVTGGNPVNVTAPYKMTIAGTPTTQGSWTVTVTAWGSSGGTGDRASVTCVFTITAGSTTSPPTFSTQPQSTTVNVGGSTTFTVAASGSPTPTYQWYRGSTLLTGQTAATLSLTNIQTSDAGSYAAVATNSAGSATSNAATLTVNSAPSITAQPQSATTTVGSSVTFSVTASGSTPLSFQWQKGGTAITGATSASYTIASAQTTDAGNYTVVVSNSIGSVTSSAATLTVNSAPAITGQPQSLSVVAGASASFSVTATGAALLTYQWQKGGTAIIGATSATYTIASTQTTDAGSFTVVVTNGAGSTTSSAATLTVSANAVAPTITTQPQSAAITVGGNVTFTAAATGTAPLTYQWQKNGTAITGATSGSLTLSNAQTSDAANYRVVVTNSAGSATSAAATLTVNPPSVAPAFTVQPVSHSVAIGHDVSFSAMATGYPTPSYTWSVSTNAGTSWTAVTDGTNYAGSTGLTLTVKNAAAGMSGNLYRCSATNSSGNTASLPATLTVTSPAFPAPAGLAIAPSNVISVADMSANVIQSVGTTGSVTALAGTSGQQGSADGTGAAALFRQPNAVALDGSGNVYVADTANSIIRKITPAGVVTTLAGSSSNQGYRDGTGTAAWFNTPASLTVDGLGVVYVADSGNAVIRKIALDGTVTTLAGTAGSTGSTDGTGAAARFNQPSGIVVDSTGTLYVSDTLNHTVRKVTSAGVVTTLAGLAGVSGSTDGTGTGASFNQPRGLCTDGGGNLYVADTANSSIRKIVIASGATSTFAGLPTISGLLDGNAIEAWFNQPRDVKIDSSGNLFVADTGNAVLRKITPAGAVTTMSLTISSPPSSGGSSSGVGTAPATSDQGAPPGKSGAGDMPAWFAISLLAIFIGSVTVRRFLRCPS